MDFTFNHTPGPWNLEPEKIGIFYVVRGLTQSKEEGYGDDYHGIITMINSETNPKALEDAKLIAAAPEMADTLDAVLNHFDKAQKFCESDYDWMRDKIVSVLKSVTQ